MKIICRCDNRFLFYLFFYLILSPRGEDRKSLFASDKNWLSLEGSNENFAINLINLH